VDPLVRKVAARYAMAVAMEGPNPPIPAWVFAWGDKTARGVCPDIKPFPCPHCGGIVVPPSVMTEEDVFQTARESVETMLPTFHTALTKKFQDKFHMNVSATKSRVFYFFAAKVPLENVAVQLMMKGHQAFMSVMYAPVNLHGEVDYKGAVEMKSMVEDPEMAGLRLMHLAHQVFARV
jgi:hypothetical protein